MTRAKNTPEAEETAVETVDLYNANAGVHGRDGGPYLDEIQGVFPLVTKENLIANYNNQLLGGDEHKTFEGEVTAPVVASIPVEDVTPEPEPEPEPEVSDISFE